MPYQYRLFTTPSANSSPGKIVTGPDGNLWFTEQSANKIGRITPNGDITEFSIPTPDSQPLGITAGPDGNIWFTEYNANKIGRITPDGDLTEFALPPPYENDTYQDNFSPRAITVGSDGNLWFTSNFAGLRKITPNGDVSGFAAPMSWDIVAGQDGNLWFTAWYDMQVGRATLTGSIVEAWFPNFSSGQVGGGPFEITSSPNGNLWFIGGTESIGMITLSGFINPIPLPAPGFSARAVAACPDGSIWFAGSDNQLWQLISEWTPGPIAPPPYPFSVTPFPSGLPAGSLASGIACGPNESLWITAWPNYIVGMSIGADLKLTMKGATRVKAGNDLKYAITVKNIGPDTAFDVIVADDLPKRTNPVSITPSTGGTYTTQRDGSLWTVKCFWQGRTSPDQKRSVTIVASVKGGIPDGTVLSNRAEASSLTFDPDTTNNSATVETTVQS